MRAGTGGRRSARSRGSGSPVDRHHEQQRDGEDQDQERDVGDGARTGRRCTSVTPRRQERADHEHVAVGEVDELDDPVDHRVAEGDQGVDRADRQGVDRLLDRDAEGPIGRQRAGPDQPRLLQGEEEQQLVDDDRADAKATIAQAAVRARLLSETAMVVTASLEWGCDRQSARRGCWPRLRVMRVRPGTIAIPGLVRCGRLLRGVVDLGLELPVLRGRVVRVDRHDLLARIAVRVEGDVALDGLVRVRACPTIATRTASRSAAMSAGLVAPARPSASSKTWAQAKPWAA